MRRNAPDRSRPLGVAVVVVVAALSAGCVGGAEQAPLYGNPKILLDRTVDNLTRVYVHSAFGERAYGEISVRIDNATVASAEDTYALVHKTNLTSFALEVEARSPAANYTTVVLVRMLAEDAEVAIAEDEGFDAFREVALPWQKVVDERREEDA